MYEIDVSRLCKLAESDKILYDFGLITTIYPIPSTFYVTIDLKNDYGYDGLKFFRQTTDTEPYFCMGYLDDCFYCIVVMLKLLGKLLVN